MAAGLSLWLVSLPPVLAGVIVIGLMFWPIAARVQVELTTERVEFEVGAMEQGKTTLGELDVRSIAIEKFATLTFEPESVEVADPSQYQVKTDDFPAAAWKTLSVASSKVILAAKDQTRHPRMTVEGQNGDGQGTIHLDSMVVADGTRVTLETRGGKNEGLTVKVAGQENINLSLHEPFKVIADHVELRGVADPLFQRNDELTYRVTLPERAPGSRSLCNRMVWFFRRPSPPVNPRRRSSRRSRSGRWTSPDRIHPVSGSVR